MIHRSDQGIIVGIKNHGEKNTLLFIFTKEKGLCAGILRGGQSLKKKVFIQIGTWVNTVWKARLEEHLGEWQVEPLSQILPFILESQPKLLCLEVLSQLLWHLLPQHHPYERLYQSFLCFQESLKTENFMEYYIRFEVDFLKEMGFGLDLSRCAVTNAFNNLTHVSPKTGRAVCATVAAPYADRLLVLPPFLHKDAQINMSDVQSGFKLTGYFLKRHFMQPKLDMVFQNREKLLEVLYDARN